LFVMGFFHFISIFIWAYRNRSRSRVFDLLSMHHAYLSQEALEVVFPTDLEFSLLFAIHVCHFSAFLLAIL
jgi:hypothetical protein